MIFLLLSFFLGFSLTPSGENVFRVKSLKENILELQMFQFFATARAFMRVTPVFKVVRNSFPFSIPTELYERLTRL